jgi:hypothetical protein
MATTTTMITVTIATAALTAIKNPTVCPTGEKGRKKTRRGRVTCAELRFGTHNRLQLTACSLRP